MQIRLLGLQEWAGFAASQTCETRGRRTQVGNPSALRKAFQAEPYPQIRKPEQRLYGAGTKLVFQVYRQRKV